jgi:hypothetical protein
MNRLTGFAALAVLVRERARRTAYLCAAATAVAAVGGCAAATHASDAAHTTATHGSNAVHAAATHANGANGADGAIGACESTQWTFGKPVPEGDGPVMYLPVQVRYTSGPRCRLDIEFTAKLTDGSGRLVPGGTATGSMRAVIGPAPGERVTALTSMPRSSFLWSNWCGPAAGLIRAVVTTAGHVGTTTTSERPMCLDPRQPISFTWGAPKKVP